MMDPQVAFDKLSQFETADEIAEYLKSENITGVRQGAFHCPIANYMQKHTGLKFGTTAIDTIATIWDETEDGDDSYPAQVFDFAHTDAMYDFVEKFDEGAYESLIDEGTEDLFNL